MYSRIGGSLKMTIAELMAFHTATQINSLYDLQSLLQGNSSNLVSTFTKADIVQEKASFPASLKW